MKKTVFLLILAGFLMAGCSTRQEIHHIGEFFPEDDRFWEVVPEGNLLGTIGLPLQAANLAFGRKEKEIFITARSMVVRVALN